MWIFQSVLIFMLVVALYCLYRNEKVLKMQLKWLDEEYAYNVKRIHEGKGFRGRYLRDEQIPSQNKMVWMFWIPLSSFAKRVKPVEEYYTGK